jgi:hypothetical protein
MFDATAVTHKVVTRVSTYMRHFKCNKLLRRRASRRAARLFSIRRHPRPRTYRQRVDGLFAAHLGQLLKFTMHITTKCHASLEFRPHPTGGDNSNKGNPGSEVTLERQPIGKGGMRRQKPTRGMKSPSPTTRMKNESSFIYKRTKGIHKK